MDNPLRSSEIRAERKCFPVEYWDFCITERSRKFRFCVELPEDCTRWEALKNAAAASSFFGVGVLGGFKKFEASYFVSWVEEIKNNRVTFLKISEKSTKGRVNRLMVPNVMEVVGQGIWKFDSESLFGRVQIHWNAHIQRWVRAILTNLPKEEDLGDFMVALQQDGQEISREKGLKKDCFGILERLAIPSNHDLHLFVEFDDERKELLEKELISYGKFEEDAEEDFYGVEAVKVDSELGSNSE
ncbi:unnamed protein product [Ilex paraguariensis]|uniref:Uncharacterized protein n=1 Tax=Ilex paraguariensis TaxID=185542 RepID=A0ABC8QW54_9AQUA